MRPTTLPAKYISFHNKTIGYPNQKCIFVLFISDILKRSFREKDSYESFVNPDSTSTPGLTYHAEVILITLNEVISASVRCAEDPHFNRRQPHILPRPQEVATTNSEQRSTDASLPMVLLMNATMYDLELYSPQKVNPRRNP